MKKIFVSIVNFNGSKDTIECIHSLDKLNLENFDIKILVIDNASNEPFQLEKKGLKHTSFELIRNVENSGYSGGHNVGISHALSKGADYIVLLNNDTVVDKNLIKELVNQAELNKDAGIIVPKIYFAKNYEYHKERYSRSQLGRIIWYAGGRIDWENMISYHIGVDEVDSGQFDSSGQTELATGCCMLLTRELIQNIGKLDPKYFLYYEDSDFSIRAKKAGFKIIYSPGAILWHKNAGSTGGSGSELQDYYTSRNRMVFGMKYAPIRTKLALFKESIRLLTNGRTYQKKGIKDFYLGKLGKGSFPI